jgi:hypothetical protein
MNKTTMQTYTGALVDLAAISPEDIRLPDIAHALSLVNRFTGHTRVPYSVAQHSVMVSELCAPEHALWGLLHDASEAYLGDVATPLKHMLPEYRELEERVQRAIAVRFELSWPMPQDVHVSDKRALMFEKRALLLVDHDWGIEAEAVGGALVALSWMDAKDVFEERYKELVK